MKPDDYGGRPQSAFDRGCGGWEMALPKRLTLLPLRVTSLAEQDAQAAGNREEQLTGPFKRAGRQQGRNWP
jgi:hypothetical protein